MNSLSLDLTPVEWGRVYHALAKARKSARGRASYYKSESGRWSTSTPEMDHQHALMEAEDLRSLMERVANLLGREPSVVVWGADE